MFPPAAANQQMAAGFNAYGQQPVNGQFTAGAVTNGTANQWGAAPVNNQWGAANPTASANQWAAVPSKQPTSVNPFLVSSLYCSDLYIVISMCVLKAL